MYILYRFTMLFTESPNMSEQEYKQDPSKSNTYIWVQDNKEKHKDKEKEKTDSKDSKANNG